MNSGIDKIFENVLASSLERKFMYLILLAGFIPLLLFAVPLYYSSTNTMEKRAKENLRDYSRLASNGLFRVLRSAENELERLSANQIDTISDENSMLRNLYRIALSQDQLNSDKTPWSSFPTKTFNALKKGKTVLSPPYRSGGNVTLSLLTRTSGGSVLVGELNPIKLWQSTRKSHMGSEDEVLIINSNGRILNSSNHEIFEPFSRIKPSMRPSTKRVRYEFGKTNLKIGSVIWGRKTLYLKARFESGQWYVFSLRPSESVTSLPMRLVRTLGIYLLISILILILIAFRFAKRMVAPVKDLIGVTNRMADGNLDQTLSVDTGDELEDLANSFNELSNSLQETTVSRNYLENILSSMNEGLMVLDADGSVKRVNKAFLNLVGRRESEVTGTSFDTVVSGSSGDDLRSDILEGRRIKQRDVTLRTASGGDIPVLFSATPMSGDNNQRDEIVCVVTDITELKKARQNLQQTTEEKQTLLEEIHHRVKNNMQVIMSLLSLQSEDFDDDDIRKIFENSQRRIRSMALVHEKLYQADSMASLNMENYIRDLVDGLVESQSTIQPGLDVTYTIDKNLDLAIDLIIPCGLILNELVTNSIEHAFDENSPNPEIKVKFIHRNGEYRLTVFDNGNNLSSDFDVAESGDSLGLQLVYDLAENQLDGDVTIKTEHGTEFTIIFPG